MPKKTPKKENINNAAVVKNEDNENSPGPSKNVNVKQEQTKTKKHINFVSGPIKNKRVTELPGIAGVIGTKLTALGFDKARKLLGQYLIMEENGEQFKIWLKEKCGANEEKAEMCLDCLKEWTSHYL